MNEDFNAGAEVGNIFRYEFYIKSSDQKQWALFEYLGTDFEHSIPSYMFKVLDTSQVKLYKIDAVINFIVHPMKAFKLDVNYMKMKKLKGMLKDA